MKGALIHGVLLAVMLVYGYRTWTREAPTGQDLGAIVLWDKGEADLASIELTTERKVVKLERRGAGGAAYWWGSDTTIDKKPKAPPPAPTPPVTPDAGVPAAATPDGGAPGDAGVPGDAGAPGDAGVPGDAAPSDAAVDAAPPPVEMVETRTTREFPLGEAADKLITSLSAARALRDLGAPTAELKKDYKLTDAKTTLVVTFKDGPRKFLVGGSVFGGGDRYVLEEATGKAYVLSKELVSALELGESGLHLTDPRGFDGTKLERAVVDVGGKTRSAAKVQAGAEGQQFKTWGDPATGKPDASLGNFVDAVGNLRPTEYKVDLKIADLTPILSVTFQDGRGEQLGTLALYKRVRKPAAEAAAPVGPIAQKDEFEYLIVTPKTRVPGLVAPEMAKRIEDDVPTLWGGKSLNPAPPPGQHGMPGPHGGMPGMPGPGGDPFGAMPPGHGAPPAPAAGGPAPGAPAPGAPGAPAPGAPGAPAKAPATPAAVPAKVPATPAAATPAKAPAPPAAAPAKAPASPSTIRSGSRTRPRGRSRSCT
jgi:hypothetical protein